MARPYKIILVASIIITAFLFWHDIVYDKPSVPYTLKEELLEIVITGSILTGLIFGFLSAVYFLSEQWGKLFKSK